MAGRVVIFFILLWHHSSYPWRWILSSMDILLDGELLVIKFPRLFSFASDQEISLFDVLRVMDLATMF